LAVDRRDTETIEDEGSVIASTTKMRDEAAGC